MFLQQAANKHFAFFLICKIFNYLKTSHAFLTTLSAFASLFFTVAFALYSSPFPIAILITFPKKKSISNFAGPLDQYAEIDGEVDVEQCSDSEAATRRNIERQRQTPQTSLASPPCASDDERLTPEQIPVHFHF